MGIFLGTGIGHASTGPVPANATALSGEIATNASAGGVGPALQQGVRANCTLSTGEAQPGAEVTLIADGSTNADNYRYDRDGDGEWDTDILFQESYTVTYSEPGNYTPAVQAINQSTEATDQDTCGTLTIQANQPPAPELSYSPSDPAVNEPITFDPAGTTDPDGDRLTTFRYDWNGTGSYDSVAEGDYPVTHSYGTRGSRTVTLQVEDEHGATATTSVTFFVGARDPRAACSVSAESVGVGDQIEIDASNSENAQRADFDINGDGTYEYRDEEDLVVQHRYETAGTYEVAVRAESGDGEFTDVGSCGTVTVTANQPPDAAFDISPQRPSVDDAVTFDAAGSTDSDGTIETYRWDFDGDSTIEQSTRTSQVTHRYNSSGRYAPSLTIVDNDGATDSTSRELDIEEPLSPAPTTSCTIGTTTLTVDESVIIDASGSDGVTSLAIDLDGDGRYEIRDRTTLVINATISEPGEYTVVARGTNDGGNDTVECGTITVEQPEEPVTEQPNTEPGSTVSNPSPTATETASEDEDQSGGPVPPIPDLAVPILGGLLGVAGLGAGYYLYPSGGGGGGGGSNSPPKPPSAPPSSKSANYETGTFLTPPQSGPVTVSGLGFEPDLVTVTATTNVRASDGGVPSERSDGWSHGRAMRAGDGTVSQTVATLTDDVESVDAGLATSLDGHAVELDFHDDAPPERITGQVTSLTDDGFEMEFDLDGLRGDRTHDQFAVHYKAFSFGKGSRVDVGHFQTPGYPCSQSIPMAVDADHVILTATNALETVDDRRSTDLPIGFSHGEVVGRTAPAQFAWNATVDPAGLCGTGQAAFDDRALHLLYARDGAILGRTTARVTSLGESLDMEYETVYSGPAKLGSAEPKLVTYVAVDTNDHQPSIGYFQLPEATGDETFSVEVGFEPRLVEFTMLGIEEMNTDQLSRASPMGFGWSHGSAIDSQDPQEGVRQYVLNDATDPERSTHEPHANPGHRGVAGAVCSVSDGGRIHGRDGLTVTGFTADGFEATVTDVTGTRNDGQSRPYVFYKAWPTL